MATSAAQLSLIVKTLCTEFELNEKHVLKHLSNQDLLPAKLNKTETAKSVSIFASKKAEELATTVKIVPEGTGSGKFGKFTLTDIQKLLIVPVKTKLIISPNAQKYATENEISLENIEGSGKNGRILLKDLVKDDDEKINISKKALIYAKDNLPEQDLKLVNGSGKGGRILLTDLKAIQQCSDSESESDSE